MNIDNISLITLMFFNIILSVKFLMSCKNYSGKTLSILAGHLSVSALVVSEILLFLNKINLQTFETLMSFICGWLFGITAQQVSMLSIKDMTKKKMTTLWKTPVVAGLAAMLLKTNYIGFLLVGFLGICFYIVYQNRPRLRYLFPKLIVVLASVPFFFFVTLSELWILNLGITVFVLTTNVFHNLVFASNLLAVHED